MALPQKRRTRYRLPVHERTGHWVGPGPSHTMLCACPQLMFLSVLPVSYHWPARRDSLFSVNKVWNGVHDGPARIPPPSRGRSSLHLSVF